MRPCPDAGAASPRTSKNAALRTRLEMHFKQVELHSYHQVLRVTEAEPLAAYIMSIQSPDETTRAKLIEFLRGVIAARRILSFHPKFGLLTARD